MDKCIFCNSSSYGSCSQSPHGKHEHAGTKNTVFFAVQVHTAPAQTARIKNTSTVKAARNASIAVHLQSVLAAAARTESTKGNSLGNRKLHFYMILISSFSYGDTANQKR